jgi:hypothetical protein
MDVNKQVDFNRVVSELKSVVQKLRGKEPSELSFNYILMGIQVFVILVSFVIILARYADIYPDQRVAATYIPTQCTIVAQKMTNTDESYGVGFRANFYVSYLAGGVSKNAAVAANGLDLTPVPDESSQQDYLNQYKVGQQYPCWYNPHNPDVAVLVLRHDWSAAYALLPPSFVLLIVAFYFLMTIRKILIIRKEGPKEKPTNGDSTPP